MNKVKIVIIIILCIFSLSCQKKQEESLKPSCVITFIQQSVFFKDKDNNVKELTVGDNLEIGDVITTGNNASCELEFNYKTILRINENSEVTLSNLLFDSDKGKDVINLISGQILVKSDKLEKDTDFIVETDKIALGIRGTEYKVINRSGDNTIYVKEGSVAIKKRYQLEELNNLKKNDPELYDKIVTGLEEEVYINKMEKVVISKNIYEKELLKLDQELMKINHKIIAGEEISKKEITNIIELNKINKNKMSKEELMSEFPANEIKTIELKIQQTEKKAESEDSNREKKTEEDNSITSDAKKIFLKRLSTRSKGSVKTIYPEYPDNKFSQLVFESLNNKVIVTRLRIFFTDETDYTISENFVINSVRTKKNIYILNIENFKNKKIEKIRVALNSKEDVSEETRINVYGIR